MTGKEMTQIRQIAEVAKANTVTPSDGYAHIITTCKTMLNAPYRKSMFREQTINEKKSLLNNPIKH